MAQYFSMAALRFLRALRRNNDRVWFAERLELYRHEVQGPMTRLCEDISEELADFAPGHMAPAQKAMMRIYANVRFHPDKPPLKTHLGAWWGLRGVKRTSGAGYYLQLGVNEFKISAGCFMPSPDQLRRIREAIARDPKLLRKLLAQTKLRKVLPESICNSLKRAPKGFSERDPAIDLLRCVRWGVAATLPPEIAVSSDLLDEVLTRFRAAAPLVAALNEPILASTRKPVLHTTAHIPKGSM